jgi:hypothetical protein
MGKILFLVGMFAIGGYYLVHNMPSATVFPYSKEQVQAILVDAKTTLPRRDGHGQIEIWGAGRSEKGVTLHMKYASEAPLLTCQAVITAVAPNQSDVVADCISGASSDSAVSRTQEELLAPMFDEHIAATLDKRAFNRDAADKREAGIVFKNLGGMQSEALQRASQFQQFQDSFSK